MSETLMDASLVAGRFSLPAGEGAPWWSDELYLVLGMTPGDVQPSVDVLLRHVCVEQRVALSGSLAACAEQARPFAGVFGLRDLEGRERTVAVAGVPSGAEQGGGHAVDGTVVDLTPLVHDGAATAVNACIPATLESRAAVEQAVGCLMLVHGASRSAALEMLSRTARQDGTDVSGAARRVMAAAVRLGGARGADRRTLDAAIAAAVGRAAVRAV
jgi:hypothetical protein